jgi:hypothetical protein
MLAARFTNSHSSLDFWSFLSMSGHTRDNAIWTAVKCSESDLDEKKAAMFAVMQPAEIAYYRRNWEGEKEHRVLRAYTRQHPNLALYSTSRNEGQNHVLKLFLKHTMNLEQSCAELMRAIADQDIHDEERNAFSRTKRHLPNATGMQGLRELETIITRSAIDFLRPEMHAARIRHDEDQPIEIVAGQPLACPHRCLNTVAYGLPCRHTMQPFVAENRSVPRSLIHPRWFINPTDADPSHQSYQDTYTEHYLFGAGEKLLAEKLLEAETLRNSLPADRAEEFAVRFSGMVQELSSEFTATATTTATTTTPAAITFPPPPKMSKHMEELRRRRHGRAQARLPTGAELADIELRKRTRKVTATAASLQLPRPRPPPTSSAPARINSASRPAPKKTVHIDITETQDIEDWELSVEPAAAAQEATQFSQAGTQEDPIDLCELNTQEREWIADYSGI